MPRPIETPSTTSFPIACGRQSVDKKTVRAPRTSVREYTYLISVAKIDGKNVLVLEIENYKVIYDISSHTFANFSWRTDAKIAGCQTKFISTDFGDVGTKRGQFQLQQKNWNIFLWIYSTPTKEKFLTTPVHDQYYIRHLHINF